MSWSRTRVAIVLWIACAVAVWNVIFDRVLVLAGRRYVYAAAVAVRDSRGYVQIRDWMPQAIARGVWLASAGAAIVLIVGIGGVMLATRRTRVYGLRFGGAPRAGRRQRSGGSSR
jgi:hypothetical protein